MAMFKLIMMNGVALSDAPILC
uniref:Uncharacterized protein n=1 Tax=mine drainage metagenome TaxID=410659 RepID=E6QWE3_9ZZZZ